MIFWIVIPKLIMSMYPPYLFPVGYRFVPSDKELILNYLLPRSARQSYPYVNEIVERNLYGAGANPWDVLNDVHWVHQVTEDENTGTVKVKSTTYVVTNLTTKSEKSCRVERTAGSGTWKGQQKGKEIIHDGKLIGYKKSFSFEIRPSGDDRWVMDEYSLPNNLNVHLKEKNLVMCKIKRYHQDVVDDQDMRIWFDYDIDMQPEVVATDQIIESVGTQRSLMAEVMLENSPPPQPSSSYTMNS